MVNPWDIAQLVGWLIGSLMSQHMLVYLRDGMQLGTLKKKKKDLETHAVTAVIIMININYVDYDMV